MLDSEGSPEHLKKYSKKFRNWLNQTMRESQPDSRDKNVSTPEPQNWFSIVLRVLDPAIKTTVNKKEMNIEALIAYAGGYIGLFMGCSLAQMPELMDDTVLYYRKLKQFLIRN